MNADAMVEVPMFYRAAADAWGAAQAVAGADPESAGRAADNTFAFYTGQAPVEMPES